MNFLFFLNAVLFGIGLAMDAFSVSIANGLNEPRMDSKRMCLIAGTFAVFQILMPLIGWICVHTVEEQFAVVAKFIPYVALVLLAYIGGKMVLEGIHSDRGEEETEKPAVGFRGLMVQGVATSIDALSVGFTIAELGVVEAVVEALIIGVVTFGICIVGVLIGTKAGQKLSLGKASTGEAALTGRASILGGCILIGIGLEIFIKGVFFG